MYASQLKNVRQKQTHLIGCPVNHTQGRKSDLEKLQEFIQLDVAHLEIFCVWKFYHSGEIGFSRTEIGTPRFDRIVLTQDFPHHQERWLDHRG
jgi:hypothetical protein